MKMSTLFPVDPPRAGLAGPPEPDACRPVAGDGGRSRLLEVMLLAPSRGERAEIEATLWAARAGGDRAREGSALLDLALWHARLGHWGEGAEAAWEAVALAGEEARPEGRALGLVALGRIQQRRGRWREAEEAWREARSLPVSGALRAGAAIGLARIALRRGDRAGTEQELAEAKTLAEEARDEGLGSLVALVEAKLASLRGEHAQAAGALARAEVLADAAEAPALLHEVLVERAEGALRDGHAGEALAHARRARATAPGGPASHGTARAFLLEAAALLGAAPEEAAALLERADLAGASASWGRLRPWCDLLTAGALERQCGGAGADDAASADPAAADPAAADPAAADPAARDAALEARQEHLLAAYRRFSELGEREGEASSALGMTEVKIAWGAARGAMEWYRKAEVAVRLSLSPERALPALEALAMRLENLLARKLDGHREAMSASGTGDAGVGALLESFRARLGARRAAVLGLADGEPGRLLWLSPEDAEGSSLAFHPSSLPPDRREALFRGETVVFARGLSAVAATGTDAEEVGAAEGAPPLVRTEEGAILVPLDGRGRELTLLLFEGSREHRGFLPGAEELVMAGVAAEALRRAIATGLAPDPALAARPETTVAFGSFLTRNPSLQETLLVLHRVARSDVPVLLLGETGTGKELLARGLHERGERPGRFVAQNCAALPDSLFEAELFGHVPGAFTGAVRGRRGLLEVADQGTFFLDELAEVSPPLQAKLLRVLETGEIRPLGSNTPRQLALRLVSATNRDLVREVSGGRFREDLFYRLAVVTLAIPPLRERPEDIALFAGTFLSRAAAREGKEFPGYSAEALERMRGYEWPGNVRELENSVRRAAALSPPGRVIEAAALAIPAERETRAAGGLAEAVRRFERERILEALARAGGNRTLAARYLGGIRRTTLLAKIKRLGIGAENPRGAAARAPDEGAGQPRLDTTRAPA